MTIASMSQQGSSMRAIARMLGRSTSAISRELGRNADAAVDCASRAAQVRCTGRPQPECSMPKLDTRCVWGGRGAHPTGLEEFFSERGKSLERPVFGDARNVDPS